MNDIYHGKTTLLNLNVELICFFCRLVIKLHCRVFIKLSAIIKDIKNLWYKIIGYTRKSPTTDILETRVNLLQLMIEICVLVLSPQKFMYLHILNKQSIFWISSVTSKLQYPLCVRALQQ